MSLELRKAQKGRKPTFIRQDTAKKKRLEKKWRRPKGLQSKMRLHHKGRKRSPEPGWGSPTAVRGMHAKGVFPVTVHAVSDLDSVAKDHGIVVSGAVGMKKKLSIIAAAKEKNITVLNLDAPSFESSVQETMKKRKEARRRRELKLEEKKKADKKDKDKAKDEKKKSSDKKEDGSKPTESATVEEKKQQEKQEKDKVLTKKS